MKTFLQDFIGREDIFKMIKNESLHDIAVRVVNFIMLENLNCQECNVPTSQYS